MKTMILIAATMMLAMPAQAAQPTYNPEQTADRVMKVKDANQDGRIDGPEFERIARAQFDQVDTDGDQFISVDEMFAHRYAGRSEMKIKTPEVREKIVKNMMGRWDSNGDMKISVDEKLHRVRSEFEVIDRDQDKLITRQELVAHWQRKKAEMEKARKDSKSSD